MKSVYINLAVLVAILLGLWWLAGHWADAAYIVGGLWGAWHAKKRGGDVLTVGVAWPVRLGLIAIEHLARRGIPGATTVKAAWQSVMDYIKSMKGAE